MTSSSELPTLAANTIRFLSADAVEKAKSGHPGMPMGMADASVVLWKHYLDVNPSDPHWSNRDRFILSAGHGSMLIYSLLHLAGYDLPMEEIKNFRQWGSITPGHPENDITPGIETTTGPLGQGISNGVGFAMAEAWLASRFNKPDFSIVDHTTWVICSDGDLQEGVSHEACALAGHLSLGKLIVLYDDNGIQIDGSTDLAFSENVMDRFEAYGWHTQSVDGHNMLNLRNAIDNAKSVEDQPSIIACKTTIGFGSPNKAGTASSHGSPLGEEELKLSKEALGWPSDESFYVPGDVKEFMDLRGEGAQKQTKWNSLFEAYSAQFPEESAAYLKAMSGEIDIDFDAVLPVFGPDDKMATRAASGTALASLVPAIPSLLGGSADLTGSNKTYVKGTASLGKGDISGRYVHYGVREHGMGAVMNGMALHGGVIPYGGTFLVFSDYMRGAMRLSALMHQRVIYVLTHDSIGLGEDGPTHQPIEHMMALRTIPNLWVMRPGDPNETARMWQAALMRKDGPSAIALSRQSMPVIDAEVAKGALNGGYAIGASPNDVALIMASGSEVGIASAAQQSLAAEGIAARVVSMPCWELYDSQADEYKAGVMPASITARVSIEAGITFGWQKYLGDSGIAIGIDHFGASAPYQTIYKIFGLTPEAVVDAVKKQLA
ncbi:MAG: transketolase [Chloroflexota bacterium]